MEIRTAKEAVEDFTTYIQLSEKPIEFTNIQRKIFSVSILKCWKNINIS